MTAIDLLRLLAVPAFGWVALRDYRTRRVPSRTWYPIAAIGVIALVADGAIVVGQPIALRLFLVRTVLSLGLLVPLAVVFYRIGAFGKADAKAVTVLAVLFPTFPAYEVAGWTLPVVVSNVGVFSLTIVTNGVLVGTLFPIAVGVRNAMDGRLSPLMFVARPVSRSALLSTPGKLLANEDGVTVSGLDLDALRMYLRWRGLSIADLCEHPAVFRRPSTLPGDPNQPTDGVVDSDADPAPTGAPPATFDGSTVDDPWGAEAFLDSIEGSAYGTSPETLREGLEAIATREAVWVSPGLPFLVPLFAGLLVALTFGDVLFAVVRAAGLV